MEVHPEEAPPPINDSDMSDLVDTAMTLEMVRLMNFLVTTLFLLSL